MAMGSGYRVDRRREPLSGERHLVVNAEDFGLSPRLNRGNVLAREGGIVTSAGRMVC